MALPHPPRFSVLTAALCSAGLFGTVSLAQPTEDATPRLDAIRVTATPIERADGPVQGYRATRSATATRTDTPIEEIPQSISVVPAEVMQDLQVTSVHRAMDFAGGVTPSSTSASLGTGSYTVRGFLTGAIAYNGFVSRGNQYLHSSSAPVDTALLERLEVLKGPASGLYGYSDPGGIVNMVSKRPQAQRFSQFHVSAGSWERYRGTMDLNLPLSEDGRLLSRINVVAEDTGSFRNTPKSERQLISPSVLWQLGDNTSLFVHSEFSHSQRPVEEGIYAIEGNWRAMNPKTYLGEPNDGGTKTNDQLLQVILTHALSPQWDLRVAGQVKHGTRYGLSSETRTPGTLGAAPDEAPRRYRIRDWEWLDQAVQMEAVGRFDLAGVQHQLLLGVEVDSTRNDARFPGSTPSGDYGINIYNPIYGQPKPRIPDNDNYRYQVKSHAFNLQDQITFTERLSGQFGVRAEYFRQYQLERTSGEERNQKRTGFVPRGGLIYKLTASTSIFGNAAASFQPNGMSATGQVLEPEKGLGYEAGVKFDWLDGRLGATVAAFHITKKNISLSDPDNPGFRITAGEAVSKGLDMQLSGQVTPALRVIGAYAYTDAKITKDNRPGFRGGALANVPRHNIGLMGVYSFQNGVSTGAALTFRSARQTSDAGLLKIPTYTTVDVFARWDVTKNVSLNLSLNNIFDRWYLANGSGRGYAMPGEPFNAKFGVTVTM